MKVKAFIEIGKNLDYDIWSDADAEISFGVMGCGNTISEAKLDFFNSYEEMKSIYKEENKPIPDIEFEFIYEIKSFLKYAPFSLSWLSKETGINKKQLSHYTTDHRNPRRETLVKIQKAVNNFVSDFSQVTFI